MIKGIIPKRRDGDGEPEETTLDLRGRDPYGSGSFGASRGDRIHNGIDYAASESAKIISPVVGEVTKLGYPYADDLGYKYVQITDCFNYDHRLFYVNPSVNVGDIVDEHSIIGCAQNIAKRYNEQLMTNHIHYEIIDKNGKYVDPGTARFK